VYEFRGMGVDYYYDMLELSVLGYHLAPLLTPLKTCIDYDQGKKSFSKLEQIIQSTPKRILT